MRSGVFRWHEAARVSDETYVERIARAEPRFGDILYSREGTYFGIAAEMPENMRVCLGQRMVLIRPNPKQVNFRFLRLWLNSPVLSRHLHGFRDGTVAERLNMPTIRGLPVPILPRDEQDGIADLLGSLDDKIELNRQMNETLEAMAQAIFRDWFVDFGPTRRKLNGATDPVEITGGLVQDAERARALADLFSAKLGDGGLPEGWNIGRVEDVLELAYGKSLPKGDRREGQIPVYGSGGVGGFHDQALAQGPSVIVGRKGTVGSLYWEDGGFFPIDTVFFVRSEYPMTYCYYLLQTLGLEHMNTDAAVPGLNRNNAYRLVVSKPADALVSEFGKLSELLRSKISLNEQESRTLAATRDLLLPKLMSGEVCLPEAEEMLEAAQ
ncbi:restriction endonuclease subunit S [Rhizobium leguminosarum]|uniref:Restriction endonuclease subunit S n=1 Tax=Rhizobium leguminosarum TaxID=384 RepID=A0A7K3VNE5_RHILE|nr:restriction endonuclease subunit S [Rhizobium leguminosarum]NEK17631.1 restriction endonuclease subunit S [Rhizobium leguminosarum]